MVKRSKWIDPERVNEIIAMLNRLSKEQGFHFALVGGVALQYLGSDRFTKDVDVVSDAALDPIEQLKVLGPINFGGTAYQTPSGGNLDYIIRNDEFQKLYEKALEEAFVTEDKFPMVMPDYLATMKFVAHITDRRGSTNHLSDLKWLLRQQEGFVDTKKVEAIIYRYAGGRLPQEMFRKIADEVRFERFEGR
jgi:hypothetical protein